MQLKKQCILRVAFNQAVQISRVNNNNDLCQMHDFFFVFNVALDFQFEPMNLFNVLLIQGRGRTHLDCWLKLDQRVVIIIIIIADAVIATAVLSASAVASG